MVTKGDFAPGLWALLSGHRGNVVLHAGQGTTLSLSAHLNGIDLNVFAEGGIVERVSLAVDPAAGSFKAVIIDTKYRKSSLTARLGQGCVKLDYEFDGEVVFSIDEPYSSIAGSFAFANSDRAKHPKVPFVEAFLKAVNSDPSLRSQVLRVVRTGIGSITTVSAATDFCDFVCKLCWASLGSSVHACIACIYCNGFTISPPANS